MAKIIIAGGTGWLGSAIVGYYRGMQHDLVVLTRSARPPHDGVRYVQWDGCSMGEWYNEFDGADLVINLTGESINCRFTTVNKDRIWRSRIAATTIIGEAIQRVLVAPKCWINASGISIYGFSEVARDESDDPKGEDFLARVSQAWEEAFQAVHTPNTRKVCLRISPVLFPKKGMLTPLINLVRMGLGGRMGSGQQYVSWIHGVDFVRLIDWVFRNEGVCGVFNACSPNPVQNRELMEVLRSALKMPFGLPNYAWTTRLGSWFIGAEADLILCGQRIVSKRLAEAGFVFEFPVIAGAVRNLIAERKRDI